MAHTARSKHLLWRSHYRTATQVLLLSPGRQAFGYLSFCCSSNGIIKAISWKRCTCPWLLQDMNIIWFPTLASWPGGDRLAAERNHRVPCSPWHTQLLSCHAVSIATPNHFITVGSWANDSHPRGFVRQPLHSCTWPNYKDFLAITGTSQREGSYQIILIYMYRNKNYVICC